MIGRGVTPHLEADAGAVFAGVRHLVSAADIAAGNLESPLTTRPHVADSPNALAAHPSRTYDLAAAGFDVLGVANNHALDSGEGGLADTTAALDGAGLLAVGTTTDPLVTTTADGVTVAWLAFDATGTNPRPGPPATWEDAAAPALIAKAASDADVVIVGVHGGVEYDPRPNRQMQDLARLAVDAGADVVWGHGAHVVQPITTAPAPDGRTAVVATSLGNFLFDQSGADRTTGLLLEVLVDSGGVVAHRAAVVSHRDRVLRFEGWDEPGATAVLWSGGWWTATRGLQAAATDAAGADGFPHGDVTVVARGDATGDGEEDVVVSFRRPYRPTPLSELRPDIQWQDPLGRSAHVGVYSTDFDEVWVAGAVVRPVADLSLCDTGLAVAYSTLDRPEPIAVGAWTWNGFGFDTAADLEWPGATGCTDLDGDGRTEPFVSRR